MRLSRQQSSRPAGRVKWWLLRRLLSFERSPLISCLVGTPPTPHFPNPRSSSLAGPMGGAASSPRRGRGGPGRVGGQQRGSPVDAPRKPQNLSWKPRNLSRWNRHHRRRKTSSSDGNPDRRHSRPCPSQQQPSLDWWIQPAHCPMIDIAEPAGQQSTWYQVISEPWTPFFAYTGAAHAPLPASYATIVRQSTLGDA